MIIIFQAYSKRSINIADDNPFKVDPSTIPLNFFLNLTSQFRNKIL